MRASTVSRPKMGLRTSTVLTTLHGDTHMHAANTVDGKLLLPRLCVGIIMQVDIKTAHSLIQGKAFFMYTRHVR